MSHPHVSPGAWPPAHHLARRLISPIQRFLRVEAASGLVLIAATAIALVLANSPWAAGYERLWRTELAFNLGDVRVGHPLRFWVNDGLMTVFFFVVGLEIRRDMHEGELRSLSRAALPLLAALGGMLAPAAIYLACNAGHAGARGWAIPTATDIAFAAGVLALLGRRVEPSLRVLLLALAVIDDIGAIVVIAVFYSAGLSGDGLLVAAGGLAAIAALKAAGVRFPTVYVLPGVVVWAGMHAAGLHPTLAGVVLGLMTPVRAWSHADDELEPTSPAAHLQHALHRWVAFVIVPLFALANAGVALGGASLAGDGWRVALGVTLGLALGKPAGILLAARLAPGPRAVTRAGLVVLGTVAGIGFTMALFIAQLAFPEGPLLATAKAAILAGSLIASLLGLALGRILLRPAEPAPDGGGGGGGGDRAGDSAPAADR